MSLKFRQQRQESSKEGQAAQNEDLYLTAQCLEKDIRLCKGTFPNGLMTEILND
jgi:hypothetical protein